MSRKRHFFVRFQNNLTALSRIGREVFLTSLLPFEQMSKALIEFSLRVLANRGRCLADVVQHHLNNCLAGTVGGIHSIDVGGHRPPIDRQRAAFHDPVSSGHGRAFCTSNHSYLGPNQDWFNSPKSPVNLESRKSKGHSPNGSDFPVKVSAVNSLISASTVAKEENQPRSGEGFWKYGQPRRTDTISNRRNYVVCYDNNMKIPVWVAECLTFECLTGPANRRRSRYLPDISVRVKARASNDDYRKSGFLSRGHMAAAANNKHDQESMDETFLLTNVLPQDRTINSGLWNHLEQLARQLTDHYEEVRVISGPLILPSESNNGRVFVSYELIGESQVVVPTHLFKIVLAEGIRGHPTPSADQRDPLLLTFLVPNSSKDLETSVNGLERYLRLERFLTTLEFVEEKTGFEFFPLMDRNGFLQTDELGRLLQRIFI